MVVECRLVADEHHPLAPRLGNEQAVERILMRTLKLAGKMTA